MAKKIVVTNETLQEAKERVRKAYRPSEKDPVVRYIENGKMGLRHLMSEKVEEAPNQNYIEMLDAEAILEKPSWEGRAIMDNHYSSSQRLSKQLGDNYFPPYDQSEVQYYPPFDKFYKFKEKETQKYCIVNDKGEIVIPAIYFGITFEQWFDKRTCKQIYLTDVLEMSKTDENDDLLYGYVRLDGTEVVPAKYPREAAFKEIMKLKPAMSEIPEWGYRWRTDLFYYMDDNTEKFGIQTIGGKKLTEPIFDREPRMVGFADGRRFFEVRRRGEYGDDDIAGVVDETGKEILPCNYEKSDLRVDVDQGLIFARRKKKQGVFDLDGKPIVKCAYRYGCDLKDGNVILANTSKDSTLFNLLGHIVMVIDKEQYNMIEFSKDGLLNLRDKDFNWWYFDLWGNKMQH